MAWGLRFDKSGARDAPHPMLQENVPPALLSKAMQEVINTGPGSVRRFAGSDVFRECRRKPGLVLKKGAGKGSNKIGYDIVVDRLDLLISNYSPSGWQSNLRAIVPAWLSLIEAGKRDKTFKSLLMKARKRIKSDYGQFLALGLADWTLEHPAHPLAESDTDKHRIKSPVVKAGGRHRL